ncbi:MAG TPA: hypothetical protein VJN70_19470 [Gemmatimonadaceae bacterium]|nr:hypothetical protein [Gemmatimonadaceae bacterium]
MEVAREFTNLQEAQRSARRVTRDGMLWLVYEFLSEFDRRQTPSLVFESEAAVRRVRNYPNNWRTLNDAELLALSWSV